MAFISLANGPTSMCHIANIIWFGNPTGLSAGKFVIEYHMVQFKNRHIVWGCESIVCACVCVHSMCSYIFYLRKRYVGIKMMMMLDFMSVGR